MYLEVRDITILYDRAIVINKVNLSVEKGELVSLLGPNGAGKSTLLRAIVGLIKWEKDTLKGTTLGKITLAGSVIFEGREILNLPSHEIIKSGLILCPERGRPFREMTVLENLEIGAYLLKDKKLAKGILDRVFRLFPVLKDRSRQVSGKLSGGERTMLSIGRALMSQAKLLLIDEPSVGLAPLVKEELFMRIGEIHGSGITILLTEQDIGYAFGMASRNYLLSRGQVIAEGRTKDLLANELIRTTYLGI